MLPIRFLIAVVISLTAAMIAGGHGTPIHVEAVANNLVVSQGIPDTIGYAPMMFLENDDDGLPFAELPIEPFGQSIIYQIPGFDISGLDDESSLSLEILSRPHAGSDPVERRTLWYWNEQVAEVQSAPVEALRFASTGGFTSITPADTIAPPPHLLAETLEDQQGFHNHELVSYLLDDAPQAPDGAYAFFARLKSNMYAPSEPFLVVLNRNVSFEKMHDAALAINAAAFNSTPGDYDDNDVINSDDYAFWRARFGNVVSAFTSPDGNGNGLVDTADYVVWRNAVGESGTSTRTIASIPEPATASLLTTVLAFVCWRRRCVRLPYR